MNNPKWLRIANIAQVRLETYLIKMQSKWSQDGSLQVQTGRHPFVDSGTERNIGAAVVSGQSGSQPILGGDGDQDSPGPTYQRSNGRNFRLQTAGPWRVLE